MPGYSGPSAPAVLLRPERPHLLRVWWTGLHLLVAAAVLMVSPQLGLLALPVLGLHAVRRRPATTGLIVISNGRFGLPGEGRFDLEPGAAARAGACCVRLVFTDRPQSVLLIGRDQLDAPAWRQLCLAIRQSR